MTGLIGVPMSIDRADELELDLLVAEDEAAVVERSPFPSTSSMATPPGLSPADQARTIAALAAPRSPPMISLVLATSSRCEPKAACWRAGHAEAVVDLCRLAGLSPVESWPTS